MGDAEAINNKGVIVGQELNGYDLKPLICWFPQNPNSSPGGLLLLLE